MTIIDPVDPVDPRTPVEPPVLPIVPPSVIIQQASNQDYVILRLAVSGLTATLLVVIIGTIALAYQGKELPEGLVAFGGMIAGGLITMLAARVPLNPVINNLETVRNTN